MTWPSDFTQPGYPPTVGRSCLGDGFDRTVIRVSTASDAGCRLSEPNQNPGLLPELSKPRGPPLYSYFRLGLAVRAMNARMPSLALRLHTTCRETPRR